MAPKPWTRPFPPNQHLHFSPLRREQDAKDSDGNSYRIFVQNEEQSCGLASANMLIDLYKGTHTNNASGREVGLKKAAAAFPGSLVADDKNWAAGKPQNGSDLNNIKSLLMSRGVKLAITTMGGAAPTRIQPARLKTPALVLINWYSGGYGVNHRGGHFVVAARMTKGGKVVILDPWYGQLTELSPGQVYNGDGYMDYIVYTK